MRVTLKDDIGRHWEALGYIEASSMGKHVSYSIHFRFPYISNDNK